jgi:hypothetical protein
VDEMNTHTIFLVEMVGEVFSAIDGAVLAAGAAEGNLEVGEAALEEALYVMIYQPVNGLQETEYLAVGFEEVDDGLVEAGEGFVLVVLTGVVRRATIEHIAASVAAIIVRYTFFEGKRVYRNDETATL